MCNRRVLSTLFVNNDAVLASLPNGGVSQNLVTLEPCSINQIHVHPRGTEISYLTKGTASIESEFVELHGLVATLGCETRSS